MGAWMRPKERRGGGPGGLFPARAGQNVDLGPPLVELRLAQQHGVRLPQSYARVGKVALIQHQRYAHAKQFKRANKALKRLRTMLGRVIRDLTRKIAARPELAAVFALPLALARRVRD